MWDWRRISNKGERVTHLYPNDLYFAHLALYRFALPHAIDGVVLDAGSGAGYGADYLARNGADRVHAIDVDGDAVAFSRHHFERPNLTYEAMDLQAITGFDADTVDLVFSSNTLEHVPNVPGFMRTIWRLLKPEGTLVIGVPPVLTDADQLNEMANPYHLHIWTPRQWHHVLCMFFGDVTAYTHQQAHGDITLNFRNDPAATSITEADFRFEPLPVGSFDQPTLTSVFVARLPRPRSELPEVGARPRFVDQSFTRKTPRITPLEPNVLDVPPRPLTELPGRAMAIVRDLGPGAIAAEARRYVTWRVRRFLALRFLRRRDAASIRPKVDPPSGS